MSRERRAYHEKVAGPGEVLDLAPEEAHHVASVLRLHVGDALSVFDGRGGEWDALLVEARRDLVRVRIGDLHADAVEPALAVVLHQGLCRADRMEWVIQKSTELGVRAIQPIVVRRADERPPSAERLERWRRIAREAAKQSGRRLVPDVRDARTPPSAVPPGTLGLLLEPSAKRPMGDLLTGAAPDAVWLLVGPEGGLDPEESAALAQGGWREVGLGPRTLRTETAGVAASALVLHAWGDLG